MRLREFLMHHSVFDILIRSADFDSLLEQDYRVAVAVKIRTGLTFAVYFAHSFGG
jgi:hypothetical protein